MTAGYFDAEGQPYVKARVVLLDLGVGGEVDFLKVMFSGYLT